MKLSISNIAWSKEYDKEMYEYISRCQFRGIEIAPTRIIPEEPYSHISEAQVVAKEFYEKYHLAISSMQSIWYGRQEKIFGSKEEREALLSYTKQAIDYADALNCKNLVFGCPKNRVVNDLQQDYETALNFFSEIGDYAKEKNVVFSIEPNPTIYHTNFINTTSEAIDIVKKLNHPNIKINLDIGTMIQNCEEASILKGHVEMIHHVHISEPNLEYVKDRKLHREIIEILKNENYNNYISIEMKNQNDIQKVKEVIEYVRKIV